MFSEELVMVTRYIYTILQHKFKSDYKTISKYSSAPGRTGRRPVKARVTLAFRLNFKVVYDFETIKQLQLVSNGLDVPKGHTRGFTCF